MSIFCRKGGSWGTWHVVHEESHIPLCGHRSRLGGDVVRVPDSVEERIRDGSQTGVCGSCLRLVPKRLVPKVLAEETAS